MNNEIKLRASKQDDRELEEKMWVTMREQRRSDEDIKEFLGFIGIEGYKQKGFWRKFKDSLI